MDSRRAIINTLAYADIFDYPLSKEQLWQYLITKRKVSQSSFEGAFSHIDRKLARDDKWYCFAKREELFHLRKKREKESRKKLQLIKQFIPLLTLLPTVYLIGISGTVAMQNAEKKDDIDLFVITKRNFLWSTRLFLVITLLCFGRLRQKNKENVADKVCLNMLVTEDGMVMALKKQNIYTAHEIVQMVPLFSRHDIYQKYIRANSWLQNYLPNAMHLPKKLQLTSKKKKNTSLFIVIESFAKRVQFLYMKSNKTTEYLSDTMLAFHPRDNTPVVLKEYAKRVKNYGGI